MSKIFVIQPHKMLQHAIIAALFPEHDVKVVEKISEGEPLAEADLAIVDAGALRARGLLTTGAIRALQQWRVPVILIGAEILDDASTFKGCPRLAAPIKREELRATVAGALRSSTAAVTDTAAFAKPATPSRAAKQKASESKRDGADSGNSKEVIDLVDIIEETSEYDEAGNND
jgi:DNA-binding response OmpR family regulator